MCVSNGSNVTLGALVKSDAEFRITMSDDLNHFGTCGHIGEKLLWVIGRDQNVEISDRFCTPTKASAKAAADHVRMFGNGLENRCNNLAGRMLKHPGSGSIEKIEAFENLRLGLGSKAFDIGDQVRRGGLPQVGHAGDIESLAENFDFFRTQARHTHEVEQAGG